MPQRKSATRPEASKISWKERFGSLQYIPRFFSKIRDVSPRLFYANLFARIVNSATPVLLLWVGKLILDEVVLQIDAADKDFTRLWGLVAVELGLAVLSDLISRVINLTDTLIGDLYSNRSSVEIINKTAEIELSQLEDTDFYDKLERARRQTVGRVSLMSGIMAQFQDSITVISLITALVVFEPWLIALLILAVIPAFLNEIKFSQKSYSLARGWTAERRELDDLRYVGASDVTAKEVKLFGLTGYIADRFKKLSDEYYKVTRKLAIRKNLWGGVFNVLGVLSYYGAFVLIIIRVVAGVLTVGDLTFLSGSFNRLRNQLQAIFFRFSQITESSLYLKDYFDFLDLETISGDSKSVIPVPEDIRDGLEFVDVWFKYPGQQDYVLKGVNFKVPAGKKLAFVGENGAGKTTLIKLALRFYEPAKGVILLDGKDIREFGKQEYQNLFGVIFQDFVKYNFSAGENIAVGNIKNVNNQTKISEAAAQSLADEVIATLPRKYDQKLGRRFTNGLDLSGGQWQKIALARAYMKDAKIAILDEPTSALDARAEYEAFQRFIGLTDGKTAIIISHRFSTVRLANTIVVLKDGKVLEKGSHETLMENNGLYAELFSLQAVGYH
ncbi:ABC transporter ATP-binding protein [Sinomicrobium weinanense]|uniref:ABC transporter ATP-binding protein n=1 Tax=Sinomicrobium weinanense TaxID=2842200 RepID=A0A926Q3R9_9FLAO|nr:ABC transporter ATP-binding protein [Sinomicrobium weinanense]MBC9796075.1 ABC transporter ATP-binding protein [Sinomicrobium weinanense]MBU3124744.1 ABC transporter ATP-binding protein/permease [Sinomicrobium weinanense]